MLSAFQKGQAHTTKLGTNHELKCLQLVPISMVLSRAVLLPEWHTNSKQYKHKVKSKCLFLCLAEIYSTGNRIELCSVQTRKER